jgi:proline iminopeptidase
VDAGRRFFDLRHWQVVLVDQRACGASTPRGCLTDNTTQVCRPHAGPSSCVSLRALCDGDSQCVDLHCLSDLLSCTEHWFNGGMQALVADFEELRQHLGIERWVLFGGSWGTALSLAYALEHTHRSIHLHQRLCARYMPDTWIYAQQT